MEYKIQEKEDIIETIHTQVDDCNSNISDAQSYAGENYADMNDALENLQECEID